ncbi:sensor histidine kinase [Paenibacillus sp. PL91]|uniref:cache domain-containing sensor histidine kinase n=1 Tax=Paenibacillus sp. PL91 TaxID=2729538 RepID=UPI00145CD4B5|nr:sensor histidine kinase [Paenibacillus sp. PL91]MBC9204441.1 sensor histidine kinase [Paenibacillus sp. PL91]
MSHWWLKIKGPGSLWHSIRFRLVLTVLVITCIVISIFSYYSYSKTVDLIKNRTQDTTFRQFKQTENNLKNFMGEVDQLSKTFLLDDRVQKILIGDAAYKPDFLALQKDITDRAMEYFANYEYLDSLYIFGENGMVVGGTAQKNQSINDPGKTYPFYHTDLYTVAKQKFPALFWTGGHDSNDFLRIHDTVYLPDPAYVITAIRGVKPIEASKMSATMVINIKESKMSSIYSELQNTANSKMSIVNESGKIISSIDPSDIGKPHHYFNQFLGQGDFGSFSAKRNATQELVIYYRMGKTGWYLCSEVPEAEYLQDIGAMKQFFIFMFVLSILLMSVFTSFWIHRIMRPLKELVKGMKLLGRGHLGLKLQPVADQEIRYVIEQFNAMSDNILFFKNKSETDELEKRRLEIEMLRAQINPHFLYNTLNTIKWMAVVIEADNIRQCVTSLGKLLRPIYSDTTPICTIEEELSYVRDYINIMNYRFGEEVSFEIEIREEYMDCSTPRLVLQPIIENALLHGRMKQGVIRITAAEERGALLLSIRDNGVGMEESEVKKINEYIRTGLRIGGDGKQSVGLLNVNKRVELHFGERYGLQLTSVWGEGTEVLVLLPYERVQKS